MTKLGNKFHTVRNLDAQDTVDLTMSF